MFITFCQHVRFFINKQLIFDYLTNFDPFCWLKLLVVTIIAVEEVGMICMLNCHVPYKRVPFHKNEFAEAWFCSCGTPLQMALNSLHLVPNAFATIFLAFCKELLGCWPCHMPYTIIVGGVFACLSYRLCDTFVVVLNKGTNGQAVPEKINTSLLPPVLFAGCPQSHLPKVTMVEIKMVLMMMIIIIIIITTTTTTNGSLTALTIM